eukprot:1195780-Prorocentrum_minimum.AAC.2
MVSLPPFWYSGAREPLGPRRASADGSCADATAIVAFSIVVALIIVAFSIVVALLHSAQSATRKRTRAVGREL